MKRKLLCLALVFCGAFVGASCDQFKRLTATNIKDIVDRPRDYENKEVTIYGTVTDAASILVVKYFVLRDSTGSIRVITDRTLPKTGEELSVTGYVETIEIGPERWVVIREKSAKPSS